MWICKRGLERVCPKDEVHMSSKVGSCTRVWTSQQWRCRCVWIRFDSELKNVLRGFTKEKGMFDKRHVSVTLGILLFLMLSFEWSCKGKVSFIFGFRILPDTSERKRGKKPECCVDETIDTSDSDKRSYLRRPTVPARTKRSV